MVRGKSHSAKLEGKPMRNGRWRKLFGRRGTFTTLLEPRLRYSTGFWASEGSSYLIAGASHLVEGAYSQPFWSHDYVTSTGFWASEGSSYLVAGYSIWALKPYYSGPWTLGAILCAHQVLEGSRKKKAWVHFRQVFWGGGIVAYFPAP